MKCTAKIEEAVADCVKHPDVTQCIEEVGCGQNKTYFKPIFLSDSWS
jgi:hypothetical protein